MSRINDPFGMLMEPVRKCVDGDYCLDKNLEWHIIDRNVLRTDGQTFRPHPRETAHRATISELSKELAKYKKRAFKLEKLMEFAIHQILSGSWIDSFKRAMDDNVATTNFENMTGKKTYGEVPEIEAMVAKIFK